MTHFYHRGEHVDGVWFRCFPTEAAALADLTRSMGARSCPPIAAVRYIDDFGGTHQVGACPAGVTSGRVMRALERAYTARECGTATPLQLTRLADVGW